MPDVQIVRTRAEIGPLRRYSMFVIVGLTSVCVLAIGLSALSNIFLPAHTPATERLGNLDKARHFRKYFPLGCIFQTFLSFNSCVV